MIISNKLDIIRTWTPRIAVATAVLIFLAAFWGIIQLGLHFFEGKSYFTPEIQTEMPNPGIDEEQTAKLKDFVKSRTQKRDSLGNHQGLGPKDPFNLP